MIYMNIQSQHCLKKKKTTQSDLKFDVSDLGRDSDLKITT